MPYPENHPDYTAAQNGLTSFLADPNPAELPAAPPRPDDLPIDTENPNAPIDLYELWRHRDRLTELLKAEPDGKDVPRWSGLIAGIDAELDRREQVEE